MRCSKVFVLIVIALSFLFSNAFAQFSGGDGSEGNPYQVSNAAELHAMLDTDSSSYFILTADIDMAGDSSWVPLRSGGHGAWYGHIDGGYHVISNLYVTGEIGQIQLGFIGSMGNPSSVVRLGFDNLTVASLGNRCGGIAAEAFQPGRTIEECFVTNGRVTGGNHVGGIVGWGWPNGNFIRNNFFDGYIEGFDVVGGITARSRLDTSYAPNEISNNIFYGSISGLSNTGPISGDLTGNSTLIWNNTMYYHNRNTPQAHEVNATALDSTALTDWASYPTLDQSIWTMGPNYPVLAGYVTGIEEHTYENIASDFALEQNYPNPFNPSTTISFTMPTREHVVLDVFNVLGQRVELLVNNQLQAGKHTFKFNAQDLPSGVYTYRVTAGKYQSVKKMVLMK